MSWFFIKSIKTETIEPHITKLTGNDNYCSYKVLYSNKYIHTDRKFKSYEEAKRFKTICEDLISKQRINETCFKSKDIKSYLEYPETLLKELEIFPSKYPNYYSSVVPNFERNFEEASKVLSDRQKRFIVSYYKTGKKLIEIGKEEGLTRERVRQIIAKGLEKLNCSSCKKSLIDGRNQFAIISEKERNRIIKEFRDKIKQDIEKEKENMTYEIALQIVNEHNKKVAEEVGPSLEELKLSSRSFNCLKRNGINTVKELCSHCRREIKSFRGLGARGLAEIQRKLKKRNLELMKKEK